jgi:hypothetical protein
MERNSARNADLIEKCCICRMNIPRMDQRYVMGDLRICCVPCAVRKRQKMKPKA